MGFDSNDNLKMIMGVLVAVIVAVTVMLPVFTDIQAQMLENKNNVGHVAYAQAYTSDMEDISIDIDTANRQIVTNGVATPLTLQHFIVAAGDDFVVEYIYVNDAASMIVSVVLEEPHIANQTYYGATKIYDLTDITISHNDSDITITLDAEFQNGDQGTYARSTSSEKVYYLSTQGKYGIYDRTALAQGVNINDPYDTVGILIGPAITLDNNGELSPDHAPTGFWRGYPFNGSVRCEVYTQRFVVDGLWHMYYMKEMEDASITGSAIDHGVYGTVKVQSVTYTDREIVSSDSSNPTIDIRGIYLIAPISYYAGDVEHAGTMLAILWILPVLVLVALAVVVVNHIRLERGYQ